MMADFVQLEGKNPRSELDVLLSQINPHFSTTPWTRGVDDENGRSEEATVMLTSLARLFRISLSRGSNIIPIADELEHARNYLTIQKMRYKNKFSAVIAAEDGVEGLYTIKLIVQPILENAIYHGMAYADGDGEIPRHRPPGGRLRGLRRHRQRPRHAEEVVERAGPGRAPDQHQFQGLWFGLRKTVHSGSG
jgi:two-component system sensor histidine kinase YesM